MLNTNGKVMEGVREEAAAWMAEVFWVMTEKSAEEFVAEYRIQLRGCGRGRHGWMKK